MGSLRFALVALVVMVPALGPACGSSNGKRAVAAQGGEGGAEDAGGSSATPAGAPAAGADVGSGGAAGAIGAGGEGGEPGLVDNLTIYVNSGRAAQVAVLGELAADGPLYTCSYPAVNFPEQYIGMCVVSTCTSTGTAEDRALAQPPARGTMLLEGGPADYSFPPDDLAGVSDLFDGGEAMTLSAPAGDLVPAFSFDFTAPAPAELSEPAFIDDAMTISTASDLTVTWTPVADAEVVTVTFSLSDPNGDDPNVSMALICSFDMADGTGVVPATLMQELPTDAPNPYFLLISAQHFERQVIDGFPIELRVTRELETADGVYTSNAAVTLE